MNHKKVLIGLENDFKNSPQEVKLLGGNYILIKVNSEYKLFSSICPHVGGKVNIRGNCLECPLHGWKFSSTTGESINVSKQRLTSYDVYVENGLLYTDLPYEEKNAENENSIIIDKNYTIKLHAHACLEFIYGEFSLITDPWLEGPAFLGSWIQYPSAKIKASDLNPSAIWISHEHSDHFHKETLTLFNKNTPVYFPDFPNKRIQEELTSLGFININPMQFGETIEIYENFNITCFEPASLWNDAFLLIEIPSFRFLNLNDAGLNPRIASLIGKVDAISSGFSPGASGYPLTWNHLNDNQKEEILNNAKSGLLKMLEQAVELYGAKYVLPFASHFQLWQPQHRKYVEKLKKNTIDDVVTFFENSKTKVIDILPGDHWNINEDLIFKQTNNRSKLYEYNEIISYLDNTYNDNLFISNTYEDFISADEVINYFLKFNQTSEIAYCEDLIFSLKVTDIYDYNHIHFEVIFKISNQQLTPLITTSKKNNLAIQIPGPILKKIIIENLSWDEAHIGYWCRFTRNPDIYHAGFWRLLQAPYFRKDALIPVKVSKEYITQDTVIADLLEDYGIEADQILRRYGMYCFGCQHSTFDTLFIGAKSHSINMNDLNRMILELNQIFIL